LIYEDRLALQRLARFDALEPSFRKAVENQLIVRLAFSRRQTMLNIP